MPTTLPLISKNARALRRNDKSTAPTDADFVPAAAISAIGVLLTIGCAVCFRFQPMRLRSLGQ
jgi:hypothetical protein